MATLTGSVSSGNASNNRGSTFPVHEFTIVRGNILHHAPVETAMRREHLMVSVTDSEASHHTTHVAKPGGQRRTLVIERDSALHLFGYSSPRWGHFWMPLSSDDSRTASLAEIAIGTDEQSDSGDDEEADPGDSTVANHTADAGEDEEPDKERREEEKKVLGQPKRMMIIIITGAATLFCVIFVVFLILLMRRRGKPTVARTPQVGGPAAKAKAKVAAAKSRVFAQAKAKAAAASAAKDAHADAAAAGPVVFGGSVLAKREVKGPEGWEGYLGMEQGDKATVLVIGVGDDIGWIWARASELSGGGEGWVSMDEVGGEVVQGLEDERHSFFLRDLSYQTTSGTVDAAMGPSLNSIPEEPRIETAMRPSFAVRAVEATADASQTAASLQPPVAHGPSFAAPSQTLRAVEATADASQTAASLQPPVSFQPSCS